MPGPATPGDLNDSVARVRRALLSAGCETHIVELPTTAASVADAAAAIGCAPAQIAKSVVFRGASTGRPILVVASGVNRVRVAALEHLLGEVAGKADADYVRLRTGFAIGGVAPIAHLEAPRAIIDTDLMEHERVWAAAGHPRVVVRLDPRVLPALTGGQVAAIG